MKKEDILEELEDGLILRRSNREDAEELAKFNKEIHGEGEWDAKGLEDWTLDLISGEGPTFSERDFTIIEDPTTGEIVSSCCTISQTWAYDGIPFKVGRPELVGTKQAYRRRGLISRQFEVLHEWSAQRGELAQVITGIPYYYRQFGYEMTLSLGGGRAGYEIHVPKLKEEEKEQYSFRRATPEDIPFLRSTYEGGCQRSMVYALWNQDQWRYELKGKRKYNINRREFYIIEDLENENAGFIAVPPIKWGNKMVLEMFELAPSYSWLDVAPSVIRFLWRLGAQLAEEQDQPHEMFGFWLGAAHPAYVVCESILPRLQKPYSYYVRVPDLSAFVTNIESVLEKRLVDSAFENYTGELKLDFYKDGLRLNIEHGYLAAVEPLTHKDLEKSNARFPPLVFLHLLFGYRSMDDLKLAFMDCSTPDSKTASLLDTLFPKKDSTIWPIS
jgi:hypothetical protein